MWVTHARTAGKGSETAAGRTVYVVAAGDLAGKDLSGTDTLERGERATRVLRDPHVDHRHGLELDRRRMAVAAAVRQPGDMRRDRVVGEAEVVVDVPLRQRAADVGDLVEASSPAEA